MKRVWYSGVMDEELYLQVEEELEAGKKDSALWSKAKTLAKEDEFLFRLLCLLT